MPHVSLLRPGKHQPQSRPSEPPQNGLPPCRLFPKICHPESMHPRHANPKLTPLESALTRTSKNISCIFILLQTSTARIQHRGQSNFNHINRLNASSLDSALIRVFVHNLFIFILFTFCYTNLPCGWCPRSQYPFPAINDGAPGPRSWDRGDHPHQPTPGCPALDLCTHLC
jgi:hypothetical protein